MAKDPEDTKTIELTRLEPEAIIANQLIGINYQLTRIADNFDFLVSEFKKEKSDV